VRTSSAARGDEPAAAEATRWAEVLQERARGAGHRVEAAEHRTEADGEGERGEQATAEEVARRREQTPNAPHRAARPGTPGASLRAGARWASPLPPWPRSRACLANPAITSPLADPNLDNEIQAIQRPGRTRLHRAQRDDPLADARYRRPGVFRAALREAARRGRRPTDLRSTFAAGDTKAKATIAKTKNTQ
jgi:hypothetical protein